MFHDLSIDQVLHATDIESLERRIMDLALDRCGARSGAIFLWDAKSKSLVVDFHVVDLAQPQPRPVDLAVEQATGRESSRRAVGR